MPDRLRARSLEKIQNYANNGHWRNPWVPAEGLPTEGRDRQQRRVLRAVECRAAKYLTRWRITQAKRLLRNPRLSVTAKPRFVACSNGRKVCA